MAGVLFWIGRDQLKSFAVTLFLGILLLKFLSVCLLFLRPLARLPRMPWDSQGAIMLLLAQIDVAGMWICFFVGIAILCAMVLLAVIGVVWLITSRRSSKSDVSKEASNLVTCPVCRTNVSPHVIRCPHCGATLAADE